jgi:hypothetical protein
VHDSFPSHGSSSAKASGNRSLTRQLGILPERPSRYSPAAVVHVLRQCWRRTRPCCCVHLHSPHTNGSPSFHAMYHQSDVGPLSCRVTLKPVSAPLQHGIRFFRYPTPAPPWAEPYGLLSPKGAIRGFHVPLAEVHRVSCLLSTGRCMGHESVGPRRCSHLHCRFGSSVIAISACSISRSLSQIHICSAYRLSSTSPTYGCQKGTPLAIDTPHLAVYRYIVRVALYSDS